MWVVCVASVVCVGGVMLVGGVRGPRGVDVRGFCGVQEISINEA